MQIILGLTIKIFFIGRKTFYEVDNLCKDIENLIKNS